MHFADVPARSRRARQKGDLWGSEDVEGEEARLGTLPVEGGGWGLGGKLEKAQRSRTTEGLIWGNGREGSAQKFRELKVK